MKTTNQYKCDECDFTHQNENEIKTHTISVHKQIDYSCELCMFKSTDNSKLKKHINLEHKEINKDALCIRCNSKNNLTHKCLDCSSRCCQPCKKKKKGIELQVKECLNLSIEEHQFICTKCINKRCADQQRKAQRAA